MPRGTPWDDLPRPDRRTRKEEPEIEKPAEAQVEYAEERDLRRDAMRVGRRVAFGLTVSSFSLYVRNMTAVKVIYVIDWIDYGRFLCDRRYP